MNIDYGGCKSNKIKACMNIAISSEVFMSKICNMPNQLQVSCDIPVNNFPSQLLVYD